MVQVGRGLVEAFGSNYLSVPTCTVVLQRWQGSNLQPAVLETAALPVELHPIAVLILVVDACARSAPRGTVLGWLLA